MRDIPKLKITLVHVFNSAPKPCQTRVIDGRSYVGAEVEAHVWGNCGCHDLVADFLTHQRHLHAVVQKNLG